jgi:site-specific DNA recombinase
MLKYLLKDFLLQNHKGVSVEEVQDVLKQFSKILPKIEPEKQKNLLHTIINKITVNHSNNPIERSVKDIELLFDASIKSDFVLTYDTVHRDISI